MIIKRAGLVRISKRKISTNLSTVQSRQFSIFFLIRYLRDVFVDIVLNEHGMGVGFLESIL